MTAMDVYNQLLNRKTSMAVIGLGYVGMPLAVAFSQRIDVIGFDLNDKKINLYKSGCDPTQEVGDDEIAKCSVEFTSDPCRLDNARFYIIAVPTPINLDKTPDLHPVESASRILGKHISKGSIAVFESTVYPGVTEEICIPIIEEESGLKLGEDFKVGYSPERINPGDKVHTLSTIEKIVSGSDNDALDQIQKVYNLAIDAGTFPVSSIKTAEAIKVVENSQRDINIAFMNELAMVFDRMGIDTAEVVEGMNTKWNALGFRPGLVGGHCIGVDPYYFTYEAEKLGYHSQIILNGRQVNDGMGVFIADVVIRELVKAGLAPINSKVFIMGLTFKENCPDCRNSKVGDVINRLREYGINPMVVDPMANEKEALEWYGVKLTQIQDVKDADCVVFAVAHDFFAALSAAQISGMFKKGRAAKRVLIDVKSMFSRSIGEQTGSSVWRL